MAKTEQKQLNCTSINQSVKVRKQLPMSTIVVGELDTIPVVRRALFGLGALVAVIPIAFFGMIFILAPA